MKGMYLVFSALILMAGFSSAFSQTLGEMPDAKRDSVLIAVAKEVVLLYGPDYYRDYKPPVISKDKYPIDRDYPDESYSGRTYYQVTFLYDKTQEKLLDFAAWVRIWEDTGIPEGVMFGNGRGRTILPGTDWREGTTDPEPYRDGTAPRYKPVLIDVSEHPILETLTLAEQTIYLEEVARNSKQEVENRDELIRKGWVEKSDGRWERTRPDVPPHRREGAREPIEQ